MSRSFEFTRRDFLNMSVASALGVSYSGWLSRLARADVKSRKRSCIVLWMAGGPSQMDTFDLKPGHKNGGPFQETDTAAAGVKIGEHLPGVAKQMKDLAIVRSMKTKEGDHGRATQHLHTGNLPQGGIDFPTFG